MCNTINMSKRIIEKKAWPELFEDVLNGKKQFDLRVADFDVNVGDILIMKEWDPELKKYTGRQVKKTVSYLLKTKGLKFNSQSEIDEHGFVVMQLK